MSKYKDDIIKLRKLGWSYNDIAKQLGCSKATICYYCDKTQKQKIYNRRQKYESWINTFIQKLDTFKKIRSTKGKSVNKDWNNSFRTRCSHWRLRNKNKMQKFSYKTALKHLEKYHNKCYLTGRTIDIKQPNTYELDHIIPVSKGGECHLNNMAIACPEANFAKGNLLLDDFIQLCKEVCENFGYTVTK